MSDTPPKSWREKLFGGLKRTSEKLGENLTGLFSKPLDAQTLDEIEEALIVSDLGPAKAKRIRDRLEDTRHSRPITEEYVREVIAEEVEKVLRPVAKPLEYKAAKPQVILVIGVNGSGKSRAALSCWLRATLSGRRLSGN